MGVGGVGSGSQVQPEALQVAREEANLAVEGLAQCPVNEGPMLPTRPDGSYDLTNLAEFRQHDDIGSTAGDSARCSANATVAALAVRGKDGMLAGIRGARDAIEARIAQASDPSAARAVWAGQLSHLNEIERDARGDRLSVRDMNQLASVLYQTFDTNKSDNIMGYTDISRMQEAVGLIGSGTTDQLLQGGLAPEDTVADPDGAALGTARTYGPDATERRAPADDTFDAAAFGEAQGRVADAAFDEVVDGQSALVGVFNGTGTDQPNHIVTIGRTAEGDPYCYDPAATPAYFTGQDAVDHLASKVAISFGTATPVNDANGVQIGRDYPLQAGVTFLSHSEP